jgi:hypothetical protein
MGTKSNDVFVDEGASTPIGGAFSWPLGAGDAVQVFGGGGRTGAGVFEIAGNKVVHCVLYFGRRWVHCADTDLNLERFSGWVYAKVDHSQSGGAELTVGTKSADASSAEQIANTLENGPPVTNTPYTTYVMLYLFNNGTPVVDLRAMPQIPGYLQ